jgi:hypothetical protein
MHHRSIIWSCVQYFDRRYSDRDDFDGNFSISFECKLFEFLIRDDICETWLGSDVPKRGTNKTRPQTFDPAPFGNGLEMLLEMLLGHTSIRHPWEIRLSREKLQVLFACYGVRPKCRIRRVFVVYVPLLCSQNLRRVYIIVIPSASIVPNSWVRVTSNKHALWNFPFSHLLVASSWDLCLFKKADTSIGCSSATISPLTRLRPCSCNASLDETGGSVPSTWSVARVVSSIPVLRLMSVDVRIYCCCRWYSAPRVKRARKMYGKLKELDSG